MQDARSEKDERYTRPMLVALTGGIASGKTAVSERLAQRGIPVVDTDEIAREIVAPNTPGLAALAEAFGHDILDSSGALNRRAMRRRIFSDKNARRRLESILHPRIEAEARRQIAAHTESDYVLVVVPLLVESGLFGDAERIIVVDTDEDVQVERLTQRDGVDVAQARAMLEAQASRAERLTIATDVIENNGDLVALDDAVASLHRKLVALSHRHEDSPGGS